MSKKDIAERIAEVEKQRAALEAERKRLLATQTEQQRKDDTRKKIILGGIVLADDDLRQIVMASLDGKLRVARDRILFGLSEIAKDAHPSVPVSEMKAARPSAFGQEDGNS